MYSLNMDQMGTNYGLSEPINCLLQMGIYMVTVMQAVCVIAW